MDFAHFDSLLAAGDAQAALAHLNAAVPHRYTAIYRLEGGVMTNVLLVDKAGEVVPEFLAAVPFEDSFCQFVLKFGRFGTEHSNRERSLDGHRYQGVMVSYTGVPISVPGTPLWGTLCHFDTAEWPVSDELFDALGRASRSLAARPPIAV